MNEIAERVQELIEAMKASEDYQRYEALERKLKKKPAMKQRIDSYRRKSFEMQQSGRDLYEETDYVFREYRELIQDPFVVDYLDAETAVCRMIQRVFDAVNQEVTVELPEE